MKIVIPGGTGQVGTLLARALKSRRVVPARLLEDGFSFQYPEWPAAAKELCEQWRTAF